ncbi:hypothetical protein K438DRAFT_1985625 [Mycena galopus ATCC 62051]|nr:hypothetical protein K438DRAFT_1985625 [Mycena galopus ATCC 62051]
MMDETPNAQRLKRVRESARWNVVVGSSGGGRHLTSFTYTSGSKSLDHIFESRRECDLCYHQRDSRQHFCQFVPRIHFLPSFTISQIFRCYAIWNFQLRVVVIPILLTISGAGFGYTNLFVSVENRVSQVNGSEGSSSEAHLFTLSMGVSVFTTVVLMGLSVSRIWWFARTARKIGVQRLMGRYYTVSAMISESGALYCVGTIVFIILAFQAPRGGTFITSGAVLRLLVGIAPTLLSATAFPATLGNRPLG